MKGLKKFMLLGAVPLLLLLLSVLFFRFLYQKDNKYTLKGSQPICGVLSLSEKELREAPLRYLTREWEFYPGVLFTPASFARKSPDTHRQYLSIGQYGGMEAGNTYRSPHGTGTYRLTLRLPEVSRTYALELPEIFSAYRLYLDDQLIAQSGNPEPGSYTPSMQSRIVIFQGEGTMNLLLAAADYSWLYSGVTYPPALGLVNAVTEAREEYLAFHMAAFLLASLGLMLSLFLGFRARWNRGFLYALLCICFLGYTAFPFLHKFCATKVQPWYSLQLTSFYAILLVAVLLQNSLCQIKGKAALLWTIPCAVGVLAALFAGIFASRMTLKPLYLFSLMSSILKYGTGIYLLGTSIFAVLWHRRFSYLLLYSSEIFAVSLLADRILPLYEPIRSGWFIEIGGTVLMLGLACVLCGELAESYKKSLTMAEEHRQMERQLSMQKEHYRQLTGQIETARAASHDLRHHMRTLGSLADRGALEEIRGYLAEYEPQANTGSVVTYSNHPAADAILHYYAGTASQIHAEFSAVLQLPRSLEISDTDLCILLGNLLENAVEACRRQTTGRRFIYLRGKTEGQQLRLVLDNSYDGLLKEKDGRYYSSKRKGFGIGMHSVRTIVEAHGGLISFEAEEHVFKASVLIPLKS
jgi:signal transduction histidine kinase